MTMETKSASRSNIPRFAVGSMGIAATVGISYIIVKKLHHSIEIKYGGLVGLLRFIWEGDHLPSHIRMSIDLLDEIAKTQVQKEIQRLEKIDVLIQAAKMNSVDHEYDNIVNDNIHETPSLSQSSTNEIYPKHYIFAQTPSLKKQLSLLSQNLDKIAAKVDEVPSYNHFELKSQKKKLSACIVEMMETADGYINDCCVSTMKTKKGLTTF